jgi:hypothetical protein
MTTRRSIGFEHNANIYDGRVIDVTMWRFHDGFCPEKAAIISELRVYSYANARPERPGGETGNGVA